MLFLEVYSIIAALAIVVGCFFMVLYYCRSGTPVAVFCCTWFAWMSTVGVCAIMPVDIFPDSSKAALKTAWSFIYWTGFLLQMLVIPIMAGFYEAGDFTRWARFKSAVKSNAKLYTLIGVPAAILLVIVIATQHLSISVVAGVLACVANIFGMSLATLLLGYGLVEVPRNLWHSGNRERKFRHKLYDLAQIDHEIRDEKHKLWQTYRLLETLADKIPPEYQEHWAIIVHSLPPEEVVSDMPRGKAAGEETLPIVTLFDKAEVTLDKLVKLHTHTMAMNIRLILIDTLYKKAVQKAIKLEGKLQQQLGPSPSWFPNPIKALGNRLSVRWHPAVMRGLGLAAAIVSIMLVWCETTIMSSTNLSIVGKLVDKMRPYQLSCLVFALGFLLYLMWCACYGIFRLRLFGFYRMNGQRRTDEQSLLFNAAQLIRLATPLGFNFGLLLRIQDTSIDEVIGQQAVVPILGDTFFQILPIVIGVMCLLTLTNGLSWVVRKLEIADLGFKDGDAAAAIIVDEGVNVLKREKRKLGLSRQDTSLNLHSVSVEMNSPSRW